MMKCDYCDGVGRYYPAEHAGDCEARKEHYQTCSRCGGTGKIPSIKGVLIDPVAKTVEEVDVRIDGTSSLRGMYDALRCDCVDVARGGLRFLPSRPEDDTWFDDEGLYSECEDCFEIPGMVPLVGRGLILGYDEEGECISHHLTADDLTELKKAVRFSKRSGR